MICSQDMQPDAGTFTRPNPSHTQGFWYLATPYSKYHAGIEAAFNVACWQTGLLMRAGVPVFSPIAHTHPIAKRCHMNPLDHGIWIPADRPMMDAARGLIVCMIPGWDRSYGVDLEIATFRAAGKPVVYMTPGEVPPEVLS